MGCQQSSQSQWVLFAPGARRRRMEHQPVVVRCHDCILLIAALLFGFPRVLLGIHVYLFVMFTCFIVVFSSFYCSSLVTKLLIPMRYPWLLIVSSCLPRTSFGVS